MSITREFNRFDFEQQLLEVWGITNDLKTLTEAVLERGLTQDQISNVLIGIEQLYDLKFEKLWSMFENGVCEGGIL